MLCRGTLLVTPCWSHIWSWGFGWQLEARTAQGSVGHSCSGSVQWHLASPGDGRLCMHHHAGRQLGWRGAAGAEHLYGGGGWLGLRPLLSHPISEGLGSLADGRQGERCRLLRLQTVCCCTACKLRGCRGASWVSVSWQTPRPLGCQSLGLWATTFCLGVLRGSF